MTAARSASGVAPAARRMRGGLGAGLLGERDQHVMHRHVLVAQLAHHAFGLLQRLDELARGLRGLAAVAHRRQRVERRAELTPDLRLVGAGLAQHGQHGAGLLVEQCEQQMLRLRLRIAALRGQRDGRLDGLLGLDCEAVGVHVDLSVGDLDLLGQGLTPHDALRRARRRSPARWRRMSEPPAPAPRRTSPGSRARPGVCRRACAPGASCRAPGSR